MKSKILKNFFIITIISGFCISTVIGFTNRSVYALESSLPEGSIHYYKIPSLQSTTTYNISLRPIGSTDLSFIVYKDRFCENILLQSDSQGIGSLESVLMTPPSSGDYYLSVEASYGWGEYEVRVFDQITTNEITIEAYKIPNLTWIWIIAITVGALVVIGLISFLVVRLARRRQEHKKDDKKLKITELSIRKKLKDGKELLTEGYYQKALRNFESVLASDRRNKQAKEGLRAAREELNQLHDPKRQRLILNWGDRERFIKRFERTSGVNQAQLETFATKLLAVLKEQDEMPDSQKMFLKMRIPLELQDDIRAYLLAQIETDIDRISPKISELVDDFSKEIFKSYDTKHLQLDFGDIVLEMNKSIINAKLTLAAIQSAVKSPYRKIDSLESFSTLELETLDELTPELFKLIKKKGVVSAFEVMNNLQVGCVTAHQLLTLINFLQSTQDITIDHSYLDRATKKLMNYLIDHDNGEMPNNFTIEELISKGLTALEARAFINDYRQILRSAQRAKLSEKESIKLQQEFFDLLEACKTEGLAASIASNIVLRNKSLEEAVKIDLHIRNQVMPNLDSFETQDVDLSSISLGAKEIEPQVFEDEQDKTIISEVPIGTRCMVSGLEIDFDIDRVVACPYCGSVAKYEMLAEWLKVKGICPVCRNELSIDECQDISILN